MFKTANRSFKNKHVIYLPTYYNIKFINSKSFRAARRYEKCSRGCWPSLALYWNSLSLVQLVLNRIGRFLSPDIQITRKSFSIFLLTDENLCSCRLKRVLSKRKRFNVF